MNAKDKKSQKAPTNESVKGSSSKDKQPTKPPSEQPSKEEAVKGTSKAKKPEKAPTKESAPGSSYKVEQLTKLPSEASFFNTEVNAKRLQGQEVWKKALTDELGVHVGFRFQG